MTPKHFFSLTSLFLCSSLFTSYGQAFKIDDPVGTVVEYSYLDKKEKVTQASRMELVSIESTAEGDAFNIKTTFPSEKEPLVVNYRLIFTGEGVKPDKNFLFSTAVLDQLSSQAKITFTGDIPILPNNLSIGQELPPYEIAMTIDLTGGTGGPVAVKTTTTTKVTSRKVLRHESITVPAGTFDAFVLHEEATAVAAIMGIKTTAQTSTDSWIVPELGFVKQLNYDKKGKVTSGTVLTKRTN